MITSEDIDFFFCSFILIFLFVLILLLGVVARFT